MKSNKIIVPSIRAPKGYHFRISTKYGYIYVQLLDKKNQEVGHVNLHKYYPYAKEPKRVATHSWLHSDLRGKGIGTLIYSKAIEWGLKHGYKVRSSGSSSDEAERVWNGKGIRQHFSIRRRTTSEQGYVSDTWYAYVKGTKKNQKKGTRHGSKR